MNQEPMHRQFVAGLLLASCFGFAGCQSLGKSVSRPFGFGRQADDCSGESCRAPVGQASGNVTDVVDPAQILGDQPVVKQAPDEPTRKAAAPTKGPDSLFSDFR